MLRFSVADLYEKKYAGEMTTRIQWEQKKQKRRQPVKANEQPVAGYGFAGAGK